MNLLDAGFKSKISDLIIHNKVIDAIIMLDDLSSQLNRRMLDDAQREVYDCVLQSMRRPGTSVCIPETDLESYMSIRRCVRYDHPFLFGLNGYYGEGSGPGTVTSTLERIALDERTLDRMRFTLIERIMDFDDMIEPTKLDGPTRIFDKIRSLFCKTTEWQTLDRTRYDPGIVNLIEHTMVGPMVLKSGVCGGLSYAFCGLLQAYGIQSCVVSGHPHGADKSKPGHAWNIVDFGNEIRGHIDIQHGYVAERTNRLKSKYHGFLISDEDMAEEYDMNPHPVCNGASEYYFTISGKYAVLSEDVDRIIRKHSNESYIDIMVKKRGDSGLWIVDALRPLSETYNLRDYVFNDRENIITIKIGAYNENQ